MGSIEAVFTADENETAERFSLSEWWLEPDTKGPGSHSHEENDEVFYVLQGVAWFFVGDEWLEAPQGTFLMIPAGTTHDFENRGDRTTGILNVFIPGGFERNMPGIVEWFERNR